MNKQQRNRHRDVHVTLHGSIAVFYPTTEEAKNWIETHVQTESWQWQGGALCIDARFAAGLAAGMAEDGLTVRVPQVNN